MGGNTDTVSVVMAVRDGEPYVGAAIDSILGQTRAPDEVIVVDDGSTDGTLATLSSYGEALRVVSQPPLGYATALNRGVAESHGSVLAFLDADDLWETDTISMLLERLDEVDGPQAVAGQMTQFVSPELGADAEDRFEYDPGPTAVTLFPTMLIRRNVFDQVGVLDVSLTSAANVDWMSRTRSMGVDIATIDRSVLRRRLHDTNTGITFPREQEASLLAVVRAHRGRSDTADAPE